VCSAIIQSAIMRPFFSDAVNFHAPGSKPKGRPSTKWSLPMSVSEVAYATDSGVPARAGGAESKGRVFFTNESI